MLLCSFSVILTYPGCKYSAILNSMYLFPFLYFYICFQDIQKLFSQSPWIVSLSYFQFLLMIDLFLMFLNHWNNLRRSLSFPGFQTAVLKTGILSSQDFLLKDISRKLQIFQEIRRRWIPNRVVLLDDVDSVERKSGPKIAELTEIGAENRQKLPKIMPKWCKSPPTFGKGVNCAWDCSKENILDYVYIIFFFFYWNHLLVPKIVILARFSVPKIVKQYPFSAPNEANSAIA